MAEPPENDPVRETLFRLLVDSGLMRAAPISYQVADTQNGRAYRILPIGIVWPGSCLYYAAQDERLERELLKAIYERKTVVDGGFRERKPERSPFELPEMVDGGWITVFEPAKADDPLGKGSFRRIARAETDPTTGE
jgi:hypothetical protein